MKQYDRENAEWGKIGEAKTAEFMRRLGYSVTVLPLGEYGPDLRAEKNCEILFVGSERRTSAKSWSSAQEKFPYGSYNFFERRLKSAETVLFCWRSDNEKALVIFTEDARHFPKVTHAGIYGEEVIRQIPVERCLMVDNSTRTDRTIGELNRERIVSALNNPHLSAALKSRYLLPVRPFGIEEEAYEEMLRRISRTIFPNDHPRPDLIEKNRQATLFDLTDNEPYL